MMMRKRLISVVLLLMLAGTAFAGMPMHSNEKSCGLEVAMGEMDCCKAALSHNNTAQVANARLCCSINCSQNGTIPSNGIRVQPKMQPSTVVHLAGTQAFLNAIPLLVSSNYSHGPPTDSHPAYIRHLALLI